MGTHPVYKKMQNIDLQFTCFVYPLNCEFYMFCGRYQEGNSVLTDTRLFSNILEYRITPSVSSTKHVGNVAFRNSQAVCRTGWKCCCFNFQTKTPLWTQFVRIVFLRTCLYWFCTSLHSHKNASNHFNRIMNWCFISL